MRLRNISMAGIILLVLAFTMSMAGAADQTVTGNETQTVTATGTSTVAITATDTAVADDEESDEGLIGPGNALYGLTIAFQNIGETFTFNASEKLGKQVAHARQRIAEARAELKKNNTEAANKALEAYRAKIEEVNETISKLPDKDTGRINAQKMILKHQYVLEELLASHPNSKGLQRAYNNSIELSRKFESKIEQKLDTDITKGNRNIQKDETISEPVKGEKPETGVKKEKRN